MLFWNRRENSWTKPNFSGQHRQLKDNSGCPGLLMKFQVCQDTYEAFVYLLVPTIVLAITTRMCTNAFFQHVLCVSTEFDLYYNQ